jgi:hypothetical protein
MTPQQFTDHLKRPMWCPTLPTWEHQGISVLPLLAKGELGVANLVWLAATAWPDEPAGHIWRRIVDVVPAKADGFRLTDWAATGSLALFAERVRSATLPFKSQWVTAACNKLLMEMT